MGVNFIPFSFRPFNYTMKDFFRKSGLQKQDRIQEKIKGDTQLKLCFFIEFANIRS